MNGPENGDRGLESDLWLERLEDLANRKAAASQSLADLEKAASAAVLIARARIQREHLRHHRYRLHLDDAKSWALLAVPFLILIAVLVFFPGPSQQARATREASAHAEFREVEKNFVSQITQTGALVRPDLMLLTTPLEPYLHDPRFEKEALDLSILALSHAASADAFQDYFVSRNIHVDARNLPTFLTLDRVLYTNFNELDDALNSDASSNISTIVGRPLGKDQGQRARDGILLELTFLSARIAAHLRSYKADPLNADLRRVYFKGIDLGGVTFGQSSLDGCQWEGVSLTNADLSKVTGFEASQWIDANWWDARIISRPLLNYLITNQYPYHPPLVEYTNAPPARDAYAAQVLRLCKKSALNCNAATLPYGTPAKPDKSKPAKPSAPSAAAEGS